MLSFIAISVSIFCYCVAALLQLSEWFALINFSGWKKVLNATRLGWLAVALHAYLLYVWIDVGDGQNLSLFNLVSQLCWTVNVIFLILKPFRPVKALGVFIFPLSACSIVFAAIFTDVYVINTLLSANELIHVFLSIITVSMITLAALQAFLVWIQSYLLKHHQHLLMIENLPPLETMEKFLFQLIGVAFILLSVLIASSIFSFADILNAALWSKSFLAVLAWSLLSLLLVGRFQFGWHSTIAVRWTTLSFILLLFSFIGTRLLALWNTFL